jgi:catechol 2,3-dioxygenase-like lactoylglutathione lyase family enzyme
MRRPPTSLSRRLLLEGLAVAALAPLSVARSRAQGVTLPPGAAEPAAASQLPLRTTGLEHMGTIVPDVETAGRFYARLFNPEIYKEKDPPLRYYVTLGVGYLALGTHGAAPKGYFDHFCALVEDYDPKGMAEQLKAQGLPPGKFGIIPDPDGCGFQLLAVPGGLAKTVVPAGRIIPEEALVQPVRLDHVVLRTTDLEKSLRFYRTFFGEADKNTHRSRQAGFQVAQTRLGLEQASVDEMGHIDRIGIKVRRFDPKHVSRELEKMGARITRSSREGLLFTDPVGLTIELQPV